MVLYLLVGCVMFAEWEGWNYLDSIYFCVISLTKIGFGDFVPGDGGGGGTANGGGEMNQGRAGPTNIGWLGG